MPVAAGTTGTIALTHDGEVSHHPHRLADGTRSSVDKSDARSWPEYSKVKDRGDQTNQTAKITCVMDVSDTHEAWQIHNPQRG